MKNITEISKQIKWEKYYKITDYFAWFLISSRGNLSDDFIEEFKTNLSFQVIFFHQELSEQTMEKFFDYFSRLDINKLKQNKWRDVYLAKNIKIFENINKKIIRRIIYGSRFDLQI